MSARNISNFESLLYSTLTELVRRVFPRDNKYRFIILAIHIVHLLVGMFMISLLFMPPFLQPLTICFYLVQILSWRICNGCFITIITNYLSDFDGAFLEDFDWDKMYYGLIMLSVMFYMWPQISFYSIIRSVFFTYMWPLLNNLVVML